MDDKQAKDDVVSREYTIDGYEDTDPDTKPEVLEFHSPQEFVLDRAHNWVQRGFFVHCTACPLGHGIWAGPDKLMVGIDDKGLPILKLRDETGNV